MKASLKGLKGVKGLTTLGLLVAAILVLFMSAAYIVPVFGVMNLTTTADSVAPRNVTAGQKLPSLNFSFNISESGNLTDVLINFSVIGNNAGNFTVPISNDSVTCGGKTASLTGWRSWINGTAVRCYNSTLAGGARGVFNVTIVNTTIGLYAGSVRGLYLFNITTVDNDTEINTTTVGVNVKEITGRATTNVTTAEIGKNQLVQFTITSGSDSQKSVDKIVINFSSAGFVAPTSATCPTIGDPWDAAVIGSNDVTCNRGSGGVLGTGASTTIVLTGMAAGGTAGVQPFYVGLYDTTAGEFANFTNSTSITVYGLLNISGSSTMPSVVYINTNGTDNATQAARFNFTARGEGMNITEINLTRTGTATVADILEVAIYNTTDNATGGAYSIENATLIAKNSSAPRADGTYTFRNIAWNVSGVTNGWLLIAFNVSRSATGGRTVGFMINNAGNVTSTGAISAQAITEVVNGSSSNATIVGNITITGTDLLPNAIQAGTSNVSVVRFYFAPSGEQMNITEINLTRTGTATSTDILAIGLYNSSGANDNTTIATLIAWNSSARADGTYNFSGIGFNVTTSGNYLFVVANISSTAVAGRTVGFKLYNNSNVSITSAVSGQAIMSTLVTTSTNNATLGNLTIKGTSMMPSTVFLNTNGTDNATQAIRINFTALGEDVNITEINLTRTGTATVADILEVAIYNTTDNATGGAYSIENATLIAKNSSAPRADGTYTFRNIAWNVSNATNGFLLVAYNVSRSATGGRTVGFAITGTANVTSTGAVSGMSASEVMITEASNNATIVGNLTITGTDLLAGAIPTGTANVSVARFYFAPSGEQMNVTQINLTRTGTATDADIVAVGLYNSSSDNGNVYTANASLIAWNYSVPRADGTYNFSALGLNVTTGGNYLLVVINVSSNAVAGRTVGFKLYNNSNVSITSAVSGQAIMSTLVTTSSINATLSNFTIVGTSMMPSTIYINTNGTDNATQAARFNFSAIGEGLNITGINITRTGTATAADILEVAIYNTTPNATGGAFSIENATLIAKNSSAPRADGTYNFSGIAWNVSGVTNGYLLIAFNVSRSATGGRTVGFMINNIANVSATGAVSGRSVSAVFVSGASNNATIVGNLTITGTDLLPGTIPVGTSNVSVIRFYFAPSGEQMNVTQINLTRTGTTTDAEILAVGLFNSSSDNGNVYTSNASLVAWNSSAPRADGTYNFTGLNLNVTTAGNYLLVVVNFSSTAVAGRTVGFVVSPVANISVTSAVSGQAITSTIVTTSSINATLSNFTITGISMAPSTTYINRNGTDNATQALRLNFSAIGEGMNVTEINLTRTGTATVADILEVAIYNTTPNATGGAFSIENATLIAKNSSAPRADGTYTFRNIAWNVSGVTNGFLLISYNVSRDATAGRTVGFTVSRIANITAKGTVSAISLTPTLLTEASGNATIVGNITITGTSDTPSGILPGTTNVSATRFTFDASGEQMNVTAINISRTGTATDSDIIAVGLYNSSSDGANVFTANATLIAWNSSVPSNGVYNFSGLGFNVSASTDNVLLVVFNISSSAVSPRTVGFMINGAANVTTTSAVSGQGITETLVTPASSNATIAGNITITGTSQIATTVTVGQRNITVTSYNFSALGEGMNITGINLTLTGTISTADIESVAIYNGTNTTFNLETWTLIAINSSAPRADGTYRFSGIGFNVTASDRDGNMLVVVVNFTAGSTTSGGKTIGFKLSPAANTSITSAISNIAITPTLATTASANSTVIGNLTVSTTSDISANVKINQKRIAFLNLSFMARGEVVNVTSINVTLRGNASFANVSEIKLLNDDGSATGSLDATDTLINGTVTAPTSSRITFTPTNVIRLTPSTATTIFVVLNVSDESDAGAVVGVQINSTDVAAATNVTNVSVSASWTAIASANRTIESNAITNALRILPAGWQSLTIPSQTIMESIGRTAGTTQNFNMSKIFYSLRTNYRFIYYNTDGTSSGWKLYDRNDWAGSSLQYANNTNSNAYWINMTAEDSFEL